MEAEVQATGSCDLCGNFRVSATVLTVRHCVDDDTFTCRLRCPGCARVLLLPVARHVAEQSVRAGGLLELWTLPIEERERGHGMPVSIDDLGELLIDLDRVDVVDVLRESLGMS